MKKAEKERLIFADILRTLAIIMVVFIHSTANYFFECYGSSEFKILLVLSAITSSAVPLFYMLSGAFMIREDEINYKKTIINTLKLMMQTVFWTLIYYLLFKYILNWDVDILKSVIKSVFSSQVTHLWFIYPLLGLYILSPIISLLYKNLTEKGKIYILIFLFLCPIICATLNIWFDFVSIPYFAVGFPELGLFIFGKYLLDKKEIIMKKKYTLISILGIIMGILLIVLLAYYYININGIGTSKPYFDYNKVPNVLLTVSIFTFFLSLNKKLTKMPNKIKKFFTIIGANTRGIYFTHMITIFLYPTIKIFNLYFTANQGSLMNMILGTILYFIVATILTLVVKYIPIVKKLI